MFIRLLTCIIFIYFINTKTKKNTCCNNCCKNCIKKESLIKNDENNNISDESNKTSNENNNLDEKEEKDERRDERKNEKEIENKKKEEDKNLKLKYIEFNGKIENLIKYDNDTFKIKEKLKFITEDEFNVKNIDDKKKELKKIEDDFCNLLDGIINSLREKYNNLVEKNKSLTEEDKIKIDIKDSDFNEAKNNINKIIEIDKKLKDIETSFNIDTENFRGLVSKNFENIKSNINFIKILKVDDFDFDNIQQEIKKSDKKKLVEINNKIIDFETKFKNKINETLNSFKTELANYKKQILYLSSSLYLTINLKIKKEINNYEINKLGNLGDYKNITDKLKEFNKYINDYLNKIVGIYNNKIKKLNIKNNNLNKLIDELKKNDTSKISEIENIIKNAIIEKYKNIKLSEIIEDEEIKKKLDEMKKFKRSDNVKIENKNFFGNFFNKSNNYKYTEGPFLPKEYLELLIKIIKKINKEIDNETYLDILTANLNDIEVDLSKYDETLEYDKSAKCEKNKDINGKHKNDINQIVADVNRLGNLYGKLKITTDENKNKDELKNLLYRLYLNYCINSNYGYRQDMNQFFYNSFYTFIEKDNNNNLYYNELLLYEKFFQILKKKINVDQNVYSSKLNKDDKKTYSYFNKGTIGYYIYFTFEYFILKKKPILDYLNFYYKDLVPLKYENDIELLIKCIPTRFVNCFFNESFLKEFIILLLIDGNFLFDIYINFVIYCLEEAKKNSNFEPDILNNINDLFKKD